MDITGLITTLREDSLASEDYGAYQKQLGKRILRLRKRLHFTSSTNKKASPKKTVTPLHLSENHEFIHLFLLTSERAWANAMQIKAVRNAETADGVMNSSARRHVISRFQKAATTAGRLVDLLGDSESNATLEMTAQAYMYHMLLCGIVALERTRWLDCLRILSEAHLLFSLDRISQNSKVDPLSQDLSSTYIEPTLRYAAYKQGISRSVSIERIVKDHTAHDHSKYVKQMMEKYPKTSQSQAETSSKQGDFLPEDVPKTIQWRSRTVNIEDATTAQALAAAGAAARKLSSLFATEWSLSAREKAAAYDEILTASQDAVDATKTALDELAAEGVPQSDTRMQALQITRTATHYALVSWRIGRNRVLCGDADGSTLTSPALGHSKASQKKALLQKQAIFDESKSHTLKRLKERVVLYDATLQSLDSVRLLPGVAADQAFLYELQTKRVYFQALRCLAISRSYILYEQPRNSLAMLLRAQRLSFEAADNTQRNHENAHHEPPNISITRAEVNELHSKLELMVKELRGLVVVNSSIPSEITEIHQDPLIRNLDDYPSHILDLSHIVSYPPKLAPIPVKPIFLDVAYNYIEYPGRRKVPPEASIVPNGINEPETKKEARKGWFGFGR